MDRPQAHVQSLRIAHKELDNQETVILTGSSQNLILELLLTTNSAVFIAA